MMPIPLVAWEVGAIVVGSLAKAFSYEKSDAWSPQEEQYAQMVERFRQIREQRQAAISFAAGISGLPESTFYGRKGLRLMGSSEVKVGETPATQGAKVAEVQSYESQLDAGNVTPPSATVRKFEQTPTYAEAMNTSTQAIGDAAELARQERVREVVPAGRGVRQVIERQPSGAYQSVGIVGTEGYRGSGGTDERLQPKASEQYKDQGKMTRVFKDGHWQIVKI